MKRIIIPKIEDIQAYAKLYVNAYQTEPWNETYEVIEVESYISRRDRK